MSAKMIDASEKRQRQLAFELRNSRVFEKRNNQTPFGGTVNVLIVWLFRERAKQSRSWGRKVWRSPKNVIVGGYNFRDTISANKRSHSLPKRARYTHLFQDFLRWFHNKKRFSRSCNKWIIGQACLIKVAGLAGHIVSVLESENRETKTSKK